MTLRTWAIATLGATAFGLGWAIANWRETRNYVERNSENYATPVRDAACAGNGPQTAMLLECSTALAACAERLIPHEGESLYWPDDLSPELRPEGLQRHLAEVGPAEGVQVVAINCDEYPCLLHVRTIEPTREDSGWEEDLNQLYLDLRPLLPEGVAARSVGQGEILNGHIGLVIPIWRESLRLDEEEGVRARLTRRVEEMVWEQHWSMEAETEP